MKPYNYPKKALRNSKSSAAITSRKFERVSRSKKRKALQEDERRIERNHAADIFDFTKTDKEVLNEGPTT